MVDVSGKEVRQVSLYCTMSSLHLNVDMTLGVTEKNGCSTLRLESLRICLPEELEEGRKTIVQSSTHEVMKKNPSGDATEYVAASPAFTWTDEQVRSAKQERFGEWLWPVMLRNYGLTEAEASPVFGKYKGFLSSRVYRYPELYPHHSLSGLMEWYIEEHLPLMKNGGWTAEEKEGLKRRHLLRKFFLRRNLTWSANYIDVYLQWSKGCRPGMNRYQKMEAFMDAFFDASVA
jgi:hypothetical protein